MTTKPNYPIHAGIASTAAGIFDSDDRLLKYRAVQKVCDKANLQDELMFRLHRAACWIGHLLNNPSQKTREEARAHLDNLKFVLEKLDEEEQP